MRTLAVFGLALALIACGAKAAPDASADACVASSPQSCPSYVAGGMPACTWAQAEQGICALVEAGSGGPRCSASSCGGGFNAVTCTIYDQSTMYYYDPSGAFFADLSFGSGVQGIPYSGPCTFNWSALVCDLIVDAGCASGGQALDSGSADACVASSPQSCPVLVAGGMPACTWAQAEQGIC